MNETRSSNGPILGRYQVISELAKSRIGGLVLAIDIPEKRPVALRSFPVEARFDTDTAALLVEAGRWVKGLEDPAVMTPLEIGAQEGVLHVAYNYSISEPLRAVSRLAAFKGKPFPVGVALRIAYEITLGARAIEACGAPPRFGNSLCGALLPDSVLVGEDGRTRLCDSGIAAVLRRERFVAEHPDVLSYAAPEHTNEIGQLDGRTDVFTIGILLWEMLANRHLFVVHDIGQSRNFDVPPLESIARPASDPIPPRVAAIVKRALEPAVADRYSGSTALLQAIETECRDVLASHETVHVFMNELFGSIFESRARAIEGALQAANRESLSAPPPSARDAGTRASVTKKQVALEGVKERVVPVSNLSDKPAEHEALHPSEPEAPDTLRDTSGSPTESSETAPGKLPSLPPPPVSSNSARPAPVLGLKPPLLAALPALPKQFELPGAELFATPGLPAVKSNAPPQLATTEGPAPSNEGSSSLESKVVEPKPADVEVPPEIAEIAAPEIRDEAGSVEQAPHARRRFTITWTAWLCIVGFAFVGGVAVRRCTRPHPAPAMRVRVETPTLVADASVIAAANSIPSSAVIETSTDAGVDSEARPAPSATIDAGAPAVSVPKPVKKVSPAKASSPRAPKFNSKIAKGNGKTTSR